MRKQLKYAAIGGAVLASAAAVVVPAASATSGHSPSEAFGITAAGLVNIPRTPAVSSASRPFTRSLAEVPGNPLVHVSLIRTRAIPGHAEASVADLKVAKAAISPKAVLSAKLISAQCDGGVGASRLVDVRLAGRAIQAGASPNSRVTVPVEGLGGVQVTINKQVHNPDGSLTVTALELAVQALGKSQTVAISSATCAGRSSGEAPRPTPVPSDLPVTG
jgi:hypothetical protein